MAVLAAIALAVTVFVAQRALSSANDVVVRGEAGSLLASVVTDLQQETVPPTAALLEQVLKAHQAQGLRFVALHERGGARTEAGSSLVPEGPAGHPGHVSVLGKRVRISGILPPPRGAGPRPFPPPPPMVLTIELEPPVIEALRADLSRISVVAAGAGVVLLAFALAWSRTARRLDAIEQDREREQRLVALGSMSSVMAHELRNPLASLKGHAQLLAEDLEDERQRKKADRVVREAERLEELTTSLLDFVRDGPIERREVAPSELVEQALEHLDRDRVEVAIRASRPLSIDGPRLARAVHNLVDNALKASEGRVELVVEEVAAETVITVRDHGPGLPDVNIFEPFVTTRTKGTGLGLPVARRIAEQHRGTLVGENDPAGGAVFRLRLPLDSP